MDTTNHPSPARLLRLPEVLARVPVGKSTIWLWVKQNRFPAPVKIGPRTTAWREDDVRRFIEEAGQQAA
ncbi:phage transcriptional regulator, AlpA [Alkalidesulfovibrio alkalitolerans DSM 16529]|uniref:Phage transcriptional regulator, AlpA n=1 Tax=Alkalidesulfovibrio alkalitolerans DSM 16529 TaxID=1121439 RepID=S7U8W9_9BACT|nr:AlpA family phage regulatory protein [Alkalidesulfovibrio alkalitolerans]EPR30384.1 phage transcriptional regulator, AlpA [Alkalidesulfovibrio alkalitolerans DSM 16529]